MDMRRQLILDGGRPQWLPARSSFLADFFAARFFNGSIVERSVVSSFTRASVAYAENLAGAISSFGVDVPRITNRGIRIEAAATKLFMQSQDFDTTWTKTNSPTATVNTDTAPDGTLTADTITDAQATNAHFVISKTVANDANYHVFSVFLKKTVGATHFPAMALAYSGATGKSEHIIPNTNTGVVSAVSGTPLSGVEDFGTFWRFWIASANNNTGNTALAARIYPSVNTDGTASFVGATTGSQVAWGADLVKASAPTSYVPTTTGDVTRAADALVLKLPLGTHDLTFTFDDDSTQQITGQSGDYSVPTNLNRPVIKSIRAQAA